MRRSVVPLGVLLLASPHLRARRRRRSSSTSRCTKARRWPWRLARRPNARRRPAGQHLHAAGNRRAATRITDVFNDARQPTWSPDGKWIAFFAYRDGGYDIWAVAPDGIEQHKLTWGAVRRPRADLVARRHARRLFLRSRQSARQRLQHLDARRAERRAAAADEEPADDYMPSLVARRQRDRLRVIARRSEGVWAVNVADGAERQRRRAAGVRVDAPSWGPAASSCITSRGGGRGAAATDPESRYEIAGTILTGGENVFAFRASWASPTEFFYVSDGKIRKRTIGARRSRRPIEFTATLQVTRAPTIHAPQARLHLDAPRQALGIVRPVISPDGKQIAFAALGDIYVMPVGGKPVNLTKDAALDADPAWSPDGTQLAYSSDKDSQHLQLWIRDMKSGQSRQVTELDDAATGRRRGRPTARASRSSTSTACGASRRCRSSTSRAAR